MSTNKDENGAPKRRYEYSHEYPNWVGLIYPAFMAVVIGYTIYYLVSQKFSLDSFWEIGSSAVLGYFGMMAILLIVGPIIRPIIRGIINFFKLFQR